MNPRMLVRRKEYLHKKRTLVFRLVIWIAVIVMVVQAAKMLHRYTAGKGIYDIYFGTKQQELTKPVMEELIKIKGFAGFYPIYTMEAEVTVQSYSATLLLKGIDLTYFPIKLAKVSQDALNGNENMMIIGPEAFNGLTDINGFEITELQKEKLLQNWQGLSVTVAYGGETDARIRKRNECIAGILKDDSRDIFISESMLRNMMEETGIHVILRDGLIQIEGLEYTANAEQVLQDSGFTVEGKWEDVFREYQSNMQQDITVLVISFLFFTLSMTALKMLNK